MFFEPIGTFFEPILLFFYKDEPIGSFSPVQGGQAYHTCPQPVYSKAYFSIPSAPQEKKVDTQAFFYFSSRYG